MDSPVAYCGAINTLGALKTQDYSRFFGFRKLCEFHVECGGALVTLGMQAMKKADAEEAPAMKSMKAMKACNGLRSLEV